MSNSAAELMSGTDSNAISDSTNPWRPSTGGHVLTKRIMKLTLIFVGAIVMSAVLLYSTANFYGSLNVSYYFTSIKVKSTSALTNDSISDSTVISVKTIDPKLESILRNASMSDRTVILTTLNAAWAEPNAVFDLFLMSFQIGDQIKILLKHVIVLTFDKKAYARCIILHPYCYTLDTKHDDFTREALFMTSKYLHMMWRRIEFLSTILEMGYNFVFTDADVMWFRNPFNHFYKDADFQIACDSFNGNSSNRNNYPNGGFVYVRSNMRSIQFYKFWHASRINYQDMHDQDVLNKIKKHPFLTQIKLKLKFLDTIYFGGFCEPSKDLKKVCTMHANCCAGLENKVNDLKILLEDWKKFKSLHPNDKAKKQSRWSVPQLCRGSVDHLQLHKQVKGG